MASIKHLKEKSKSEDECSHRMHVVCLSSKTLEETVQVRQSERRPDSIYESILRMKVNILQHCLDEPKVPGAHLDDFEILGFLGEGGYGQVWQVQHKMSMDLFALKVQSKEKIMKNRRQIRRLLNEKNIQGVLDHTFIVKLYYSFKDNACVYFGLEYVSCGNLFQAKIRHGQFCEDKTRFFVAQVVLALEYLHRSNLIYRDLKPENLLMDKKGFLKVADFGFAKRVTGLTYTFCGTDEYMAPEVLTKRGYDRSPDWWAVGILTYELMLKYSPFYSDVPERLYYRIKNDRVSFPVGVTLSLPVQDFMLRLLEKDTSERLGVLFGGTDDVKHHDWFRGINWLALYQQRCEVPHTPEPYEARYADMSKWPRAKKVMYEKEFEKF